MPQTGNPGSGFFIPLASNKAIDGEVPDREPINGDATVRLDSGSRWEVYTHGGRNPTGIDALKWAKRVEELGAGELLITSMDADGQKTGYDLDYTRACSESVSIPVIASGGVGTLEHLYDGIVEGKADAVLAASIFHFGAYSVAEAKDFLHSKGVPMRPIIRN